MRFIGIVLAGLVAVWLAVTIGARMSANEQANAPWPAGLGSVRDMPRRFHPHETTAATKTLMGMAMAVDVQSAPFRQHVNSYLVAELHKPEESIDAPPPDVENFIRERQAVFNAIVRLVNDSGASISWGEPSRFGYQESIDLRGQLACDALMKARAGDSAAWDNVHAMHWIAHGLWQSINRDRLSVAIATDRVAAGVARKLPPPLPAWWQEIDAFDARRAVIAMHQAGTFGAWEPISHRDGVHDFLFSAWIDADSASFLRRRRVAAEALAKMRNCEMDNRVFKDIDKPEWSVNYDKGAFDPIFLSVPLFDFERDAVQHVFALKEQRPFSPASRCTDGTWSYRDGVLAFSAPIRYDENWTTLYVPATMHVTMHASAPSPK